MYQSWMTRVVVLGVTVLQASRACVLIQRSVCGTVLIDLLGDDEEMKSR